MAFTLLSWGVPMAMAACTHRTRPSPFGLERRRHPRVPVDLPLTYEVPHRPGGEGILRDLSEGGVHAELPEGLSVGTTLVLAFPLVAALVRVRGEVVWTRAPAATHATYHCHGIKFIGIDENDYLWLRNYVSFARRGGIRVVPAGAAS